MKNCRFCRETIDPAALVCKACGYPQGMLRRGARLVSGVLPSLVALGSLGIAYAQYVSAETARGHERAARLEARATEEASVLAVRQIAGRLSPTERRQLSTDVSRFRDLPTLKRELEARPTDLDARRDVLLRMALPQ